MRELPDWIKGYMSYVENSEPPPLFHEWTAMFTIASVLKRKCFFEWGHLKFYPNLYIALVGPPAIRKSVAMSFSEDFLDELGIIRASDTSTREALIEQLAAANDMDIDPVSGDMHMHSSLTIFVDELAVFIGHDQRTMIKDLTQWYDCKNRWVRSTKTAGENDIVGVWVNMMGGITPTDIRTQLPQTATTGGLVSRFVFVYEEKIREPVSMPFYSDASLAIRPKLARDLERIAMMRGKFQVEQDFFEAWDKWYVNQMNNPPAALDNIRGYNGRRQNHVIKLCMVISAATREDMGINAAILHRAVELLERTERKMPRTFEGVGTSKNADVTSNVMSFIAANGRTTGNELLSAFRSDVDDVEHLEKIITVLQRIGFCKVVYGSDGAASITFNPAFQNGAYNNGKP